MVPVGESRLELLESTSENSTIAKFIAKRGEGLHHICLKVPDLPAAVARLKKDGVRLVSEEIKTGRRRTPIRLRSSRKHGRCAAGIGAGIVINHR